MLNANFPLVSKTCSCFFDSTPYMFIFPAWFPDITNLSSGENAQVQMSTDPTSMEPIFSPETRSQSRKVESKDVDAHTVKEIRETFSMKKIRLKAYCYTFCSFHQEVKYLLFPSELMATDTTPRACPSNLCSSSKRSLWNLQTFTKSSTLPVTMNSPGGSR